jgi:dienelactone hydrolase
MSGFLARASWLFGVIVGLAVTTSALAHSVAVGVVTWNLYDDTRNDSIFTSSTSRNREIPLTIYYPARPNRAVRYEKYFGGSTVVPQAMAQSMDLLPTTFDNWAQRVTYAQKNLPLSNMSQTYPVVLVSHGDGFVSGLMTNQCVDLASRGYIVVNIEHEYVALLTRVVYPFGQVRLVRAEDATKLTDLTWDTMATRAKVMADDQLAVLNWVVNSATSGRWWLPKAGPAFLHGRMDANNIGVLGHSLGGSAAFYLAGTNSRIKAAVDLDGSPVSSPEKPVAPTMLLTSEQAGPSIVQDVPPAWPDLDSATQNNYGSQANYEAAMNKSLDAQRSLLSAVQTTGRFYQIAGTTHKGITDASLLFVGSSADRDAYLGTTPGSDVSATRNGVVAAFFDQYLKGAQSVSTDTLLNTYPMLVDCFAEIDLSQRGASDAR